MSDVGQRERPVQDRVVLLFADRLGYRYLGNRQYRPGNSNIEQEDLRAWLRKQGISETLITRALHRLKGPAAVGGESHYFLGRRYRLNVIARNGPNRISFSGTSELTMQLRPSTDREKRQQLLNNWYRQHMKELLPDLLAKWQPIIGVQVADWGIKKMKTRWGSCNTKDHSVWLNPELAKKPLHCLEYVLVYEMVYLLERQHTGRFEELMDKFLPHWRLFREELNQTPLAHEEWAS